MSTAVTSPGRVWRRRVKGWRRPDNCVIVDRTSRYGNPHRVVQECDQLWAVQFPTGTYRYRDEGEARAAAVRLFVRDTLPNLDLAPLRGKDLACTCNPADGYACHADALLEAANR